MGTLDNQYFLMTEFQDYERVINRNVPKKVDIVCSLD